ncbi:MAG TPA: FAD-dependent oxidoreductase [Syntrophales bacterium]|nr:FAD-dependent oxidoreductase [Syntrophales bacterium]
MSNRFDVIIIGAGPAGIACAQALAGSSLRVLLIEKSETFGAKICAGGLSRVSVDFGVPEDEARTFHSQMVHIDKRPPVQIILTHPLKMVDRSALSRHHLRDVEKASNIEWVSGARVTGVAEGSITTDGGEFEFRQLVAADGSLSMVRKHLGLPSKFGIGLYYEVPQISSEVHFHFKTGIIRSGYFWVFPHIKHTNIGVCYNPDTFTAGLAKIALQQFIRERGFQQGEARLKGGVINHLYCGFRFGNIFLAGDAAGLASRPSGEGIPFALVSGREIGRKILDNAYEMKEFRGLLSLKRRQETYSRLFESLPRLQKLFLASYFRMMRFPWVQAYMGY